MGKTTVAKCLGAFTKEASFIGTSFLSLEKEKKKAKGPLTTLVLVGKSHIHFLLHRGNIFFPSSLDSLLLKIISLLSKYLNMTQIIVSLDPPKIFEYDANAG